MYEKIPIFLNLYLSKIQTILLICTNLVYTPLPNHSSAAINEPVKNARIGSNPLTTFLPGNSQSAVYTSHKLLRHPKQICHHVYARDNRIYRNGLAAQKLTESSSSSSSFQPPSQLTLHRQQRSAQISEASDKRHGFPRGDKRYRPRKMCSPLV